MNNHDGMIRKEDIRAVRRRMAADGWGKAGLALIEREPELGACLANRWATVRYKLAATGLSERQIKPILRQMLMLLIEAMALKERAKDKLLSEFLPNIEKNGGDHA